MVNENMTSHQYITKLTQSLEPQLRYDFNSDFSLWQAEAKAKLNELLGLPLLQPEDDCFKVEKTREEDGFSYIYFSFQSEENYTVECSLVKKTDLTQKAPLTICLQGHSTGMHISLGEEIFECDKALIAGGRDFALRAAREGMIAVAIEQRYMGKKGYSPQKERPACIAASEDTDANQAIAALLIGRTAIGERVWDVKCTIDTVLEHFSDMIDEGKIICIGNSGGGTATFYSACIDERIKIAVPSCAVCSFDDSIMAMNHCVCNYIPNIRKYFDMGDIGGLIAPRTLITVCGKEDKSFPLEGVKKSFELTEKIYSHNGCRENCSLIVGNGGHRFYPDEAWPAIHRYID